MSDEGKPAVPGGPIVERRTAIAAVAGLVAGVLARTEGTAEAVTNPLCLGSLNTTALPTRVVSPPGVSDAALYFESGGGHAFVAVSPSDPPFMGGYGIESALGTTQTLDVPAGVLGFGVDGMGVAGVTFPTSSPVSVTVTASNVGVFGLAQDSNAIGMQAVHIGGGIALDVKGSLRLSASGVFSIPKKSTSERIVETAVTSASHVSVTLNTDPKKVFIKWVEIQPGAFLVHLSGKAPSDLFGTFTVMELGS
jgi:hypothetical protein